MKIFYTDQFEFPLPDGHKFPMDKYRLLRERVSAAIDGADHEMCVPRAAGNDELTLAHSAGYVGRIQRGELERQEVRRIGFPWSPGLVERSRRSTGATIEAAQAAFDDGVAVSLAGGTHHAFREQGEGFCVFNDSVVAARVLQRDGAVRRALVVDCDVHQGNGTASLCNEDDSIFSFSIHGAKNYPYRKEVSDLDVSLADGTTDDVYVEALEDGLGRAFEAARPQIVFYVSGADPWEGDRWGRLALTKRGLAERDRRVFEACREHGAPVVLTMAGGYAPLVEDTVDIHFESVRAAARVNGWPVSP